MLESFPVVITAGVTLGFLSGLGIGGGSLLILWLTIVLGVDPQTARSINLLFFVPSALISCLFRWKQGCLKFSHILPAAIAGCIATACFSIISININEKLLKKLFGTLLLLTGVRELSWKPKTKREA